MKASAVYEKLQPEIDLLQNEIKNIENTRSVTQQRLENTQAKAKALMDLVIKDGDRELTEEEATEIGV